MPVVKVIPTSEVPIPYDEGDDRPTDFLEELDAAANTAVLQHDMGVPLELSREDADKQTRLIDQAIKHRKTTALTDPNTAFAAASFLRTYGAALALDVASVRAAITNKLMELANCGDPKYELKALELLGKHSDIGLFTERSEITINYKTPQDLEAAIKERVKRLLNSDLIDITPSDADIDAELGLVDEQDEEAKEEEVETEQ